VQVCAYCAHCDATLDVRYQPAERRNACGQYVDRGGFLIATCRNTGCDMVGATTMLNNHRKAVQS